MTKSILVTGSSGFIGSNLVSKLSKSGYVVHALFRKIPSERLKNDRIVYLEGNISEIESLTSMPKNTDVIYHTAGFVSFQRKDFAKLYRINVDGTRNVLEMALRYNARKVVQLSACAVLGYSKNGDVLDETISADIPETNVYAYSKMKSEEVVREYAGKGLDISIANIATVYGWGDKKLNSGAIIRSIYRNEIKFAPPGGTSYVTFNDLMDGLILLAERGRAGERYIFCNENLTFLDLINRIAGVLNRPKVKYTIPRWTFVPAFLAAFVKEKTARDNNGKINLITRQIIKESYGYKYYDSKKARNELGWRPKEILEDAVLSAVEFYKEKGLI